MTHENETDNRTGTDAALEDLLNEEELDALLDEIFTELATEAEDNSEDQEVVPGWDWKKERETLLDLLDGQFRTLRDNNHLATSVLVWDQREDPEVFEVEPLDLPTLFPLKGSGCRWVPQNFGEVLGAKATLLRQSKVAHDLHDTLPTASPVCGTVVLVVPPGPLPYRWAEVKSRMCPADA